MNIQQLLNTHQKYKLLKLAYIAGQVLVGLIISLIVISAVVKSLDWFSALGLCVTILVFVMLNIKMQNVAETLNDCSEISSSEYYVLLKLYQQGLMCIGIRDAIADGVITKREYNELLEGCKWDHGLSNKQLLIKKVLGEEK